MLEKEKTFTLTTTMNNGRNLLRPTAWYAEQRATRIVRSSSSSSSSSSNTNDEVIGIMQRQLRRQRNNELSINTYHSKRREHRTNELGEIINEDDLRENILEQPGFDAEGKMRFSIMIVAEELKLKNEVVEERLENLFDLVPGLRTKIGVMKIADLVRLAASIPDVYKRIIKLKNVFPNGDVGRMITNRPSIALENIDDIERKVTQLRTECPKLNWDAILSDHSYILAIASPKENCSILREKIGVDAFQMYIARNPESLLSVQTGEELLEYDNGTLKQLKRTLEGDKKSDGW